MTVQDIIDYANEGELNQLDIQNPQLIRFINLAVIELYTRFRLEVKEEIVSTNTAASIYTLAATDLTQILSVTDSAGYPCILNDYNYVLELNAAKASGIYTAQVYSGYSISTPSYNQIQVLPSVTDTFAVLYTAAPAKLVTVNDIIKVPVIMTEAILHYVGYRAHSSYDADIKTENNTHYMRFEASCKKLKDLGYIPVSAIDKIDSRDKGYL